jgi:hypothetical protein
MKRTILFCALAVSIFWAGSATASPFHCSDYRGDIVDFKKTESATKIAFAGFQFNGAPVIWDNESLGSDWDPVLKQYAYYYECARHVLGTTLHQTGNNFEVSENVNKADCWAAGKLAISDGVAIAKIEALQDQINAMPRSQWTSFPGPVRHVNLTKDCRLK